MPIFMNDPTMRDVQYQVGSYRDSFSLADLFTNRLSSRMSQFGEAAKTKTMELTSGFQDFGLKDIREERREAGIGKASAESEKALGALAQAKQSRGPITSLSKLVHTRQQKLQNLQRARKSLERAKDMYKMTGTSFEYDLTGYDVKAPEAAAFETQFDQAIEQRKQQYAEMYGFDSFEDMPADYASVGAVGPQGQSQESTIGQRDIMDMIMSDMTGMDYSDLVRLNTWTQEGYQHSGAGWYQPYAQQGLQDYTGDQMEALKAFYVTSNLQSYEAARKTAEQEDLFRQKAAKTAREQTIAGGKALEKSATKSIGQSLEDVQLQIRELDTDFMNKLGAFTDGSRKKKVRSVSFDEGRPQ
jgi:hypothetical protein